MSCGRNRRCPHLRRREGQELNEKEIQYQNLQHEVESNQALYDSVLKRMKETGVAGGLAFIGTAATFVLIAHGGPRYGVDFTGGSSRNRV